MPNRAEALKALKGLSALLSPSGQSQAAYSAIRAQFVRGFSEAVQAYLDGGNYSQTKATAEAYMAEAYDAAGTVAAGDLLEGDDRAFVDKEIDEESGFIQTLWADLKLQRANGDTQQTGRTDLYTKSLDTVFNELTARARKNAFGTWRIGSAEHHCTGRGSCSWLDGQRHRMSYFLSHNYIPRKPGAAQVCGGWECVCDVVDDGGNTMLVESA